MRQAEVPDGMAAACARAMAIDGADPEFDAPSDYCIFAGAAATRALRRTTDADARRPAKARVVCFIKWPGRRRSPDSKRQFGGAVRSAAVPVGGPLP
jgi:hypothetical protein